MSDEVLLRYEVIERPGVSRWTDWRYEVRNWGLYVGHANTRWGARHLIKMDKRKRAGGERVIYTESR